MAPRRKGDFASEPVKAFEGQKGAVKGGKDTMPMYAVLVGGRASRSRAPRPNSACG